MSHSIEDTLTFLGNACDDSALRFRRGIERETLRVDPNGQLAQTPHPAFLGSKLTHPSITTDFSEAQPELITGVSDSIKDSLAQLNNIYRYLYSGLQDELLWQASMPCVLNGDNQIPLARYGSSNLGRLKTTYRMGLGTRYGRSMQTICAVHYNFSVDASLWQHLAHYEKAVDDKAYRSRRYFDLMRNFRRFSWLPIYLFGASPAVCKSFVAGRKHALQDFDSHSLFAENATSLRNGDLGYQSDTQTGQLQVCYNSLDEYISSLATATLTPHSEYEKLGVKHNGDYRQISGNILQSEAEFYSTIRAKCVPPPGANFLKVLRSEGVEYIEVRLLDVNPYLPLGVDETQLHFLDVLLFYCLLKDSPTHCDALCASVADNVRKVVYQGNNTATTLRDQQREISIAQWGRELITELEPVARWLDQRDGGDAHQRALRAQADKLQDSTLTPSQRIIDDMGAGPLTFHAFCMQQANAHRQQFIDQPLSRGELADFTAVAEESRIAHARIEQAAGPGFDEYIANMLASYEDL